ncbi:hypothetical protein CBER1_09025 [Cercospora berteroae]|uniref:Uncharacterized protein n=1 Tax=Cercospora berteroae TaxID=357750 RepID=A0A2S6CC60_9PEZI|nr:hypothetical protein CBER1_09025 [Cercospora berteroae]
MADEASAAAGKGIAQPRHMTNPAAPPANITGEAAMKVFSTPELLEHILHVAVISQHVKCQKGRELAEQGMGHHVRVLKMWPMPGCGDISKNGICLVRIQRVNKTFRDTIPGSTKLKQRIDLAARKNVDLLNEKHRRESYYPMHKPLVSLIKLFDNIVDDGCVGLMDSMTDKVVNGVQTMVVEFNYTVSSGSRTPYEMVIGALPKGWHNKEASWKQIKACNAKTSTPLHLVIRNDHSWKDDGLPFTAITRRRDGSETLEHMFDPIAEILDAINGHGKAKGAMDEERGAMIDSFRADANRRREALEEDIAEHEEILIALHEEKRGKLTNELNKKLRARVMMVEDRQIRETQSERE